MSIDLVNSANIITFPRPCTLCESRKNVQLFAGLMVCESCQKNIIFANPDHFSADREIEVESKAQD